MQIMLTSVPLCRRLTTLVVGDEEAEEAEEEEIVVVAAVAAMVMTMAVARGRRRRRERRSTFTSSRHGMNHMTWRITPIPAFQSRILSLWKNRCEDLKCRV